jgi:hypothetical protein
MFTIPWVRTASDEDLAKAASPSTQMSVALGRLAHVYGGTVSPAEVAKRRRRNKAARAARKAAR